jgi:thioredoxin
MASDNILTLTNGNFDDETKRAESPILVDFWAEWCGPCKMIAPSLEEISTELGGKVRIVKLNIDENPDLAVRFDVRSIPTLLISRRGETVDIKVGAAPKSVLLRWIESQLDQG